MIEKPVIFPVDGKLSFEGATTAVRDVLQYESACQMVRMLKFNDALHISPMGGREVVRGAMEAARNCGCEVEIFLDFKLADVSGTIRNILAQYEGIEPAVITVSDSVSCASLLAVQEIFPDTLIALVAALTDIPISEFLAKNGMMPGEYIRKRLEFFESWLGADNSIGAFVCSPLEVHGLKTHFGGRYKAIVPGVRSGFMQEDYQKRIASPYQAICDGADYLVIGTQLVKGNLSKGISPEQGAELTFNEIRSAQEELARKNAL